MNGKKFKRGDYINTKRICSIVIILAMVLCLIIISTTSVSAANKVELEEQISSCKIVKDTAHQMAECARQLGYSDDHVIITTASERWWKAHDQQQIYQKELDDLLAHANEQSQQIVQATTWTGPKLTKSKGVNWGPTGKETYYNLNMSGVVRIMRNMGYSEANYPYWVRADGCKMLGNYIMVAANLSHFPRGTIVQCSLGSAIVADTGGFASRKDGWNWLDIATNW